MRTCQICGAQVAAIYSAVAGYDGELLNCGVCASCKRVFEHLIRCFQLDKITSEKLKQLESEDTE